MWPRCTESFTAITQWGSTILVKRLYITGSVTLWFLSHLRPLSPPNIATAAPWLMNRPPHRNAGSSGFLFTGSTKPSTTLSAPCVTALTNALFTWKKGTNKGEGRRSEMSCCCLSYIAAFLGYLEQSPVSLQPLLQTAKWKISGDLQLLIPVWSLHIHIITLNITDSNALLNTKQ